MKIKFYSFLLLLFGFSVMCYSQGNWELLIPSTTSNQMVSLYFLDELNGWSVGQYGTITKTTDGGITWETVKIESLTDLLDVYFPIESVGYIVGEDGLILKTSDGGDTWTKQDNAFSNNLNRIKFRDTENGWAIGEKGLILHTNNGGATWNQQTSGSQGDLYGIHIFDGQKVWVVGDDSTLLVTEDDGSNWQWIETDYDPYSSETYNYHYRDIYFANDTSGWACGHKEWVNWGFSRGFIACTFDGGQNWYLKGIGTFDFDDLGSYDAEGGPPILQQIYFKDDLTTGICLTSGKNEHFRGNLPLNTSDEGYTWRGFLDGANEDTPFRGRFQFLTDSCVINTGANGDIRFSDDNGRNWYFNHPERRFWSDFQIGPNNTFHALQRKPKEQLDWTEFEYKHFISKDKGKTWQEVVSTVHYLDGSKEELDTVFYSNMAILGRTALTSGHRLYAFHKRNKDDNMCSVLYSDDMGITYYELHTIEISKYFYTQEFYFLTPDTLIWTGPSAEGHKFYCGTSNDGGLTINYKSFADVWNNLTSSTYHPAYANDSYYFDSQTGFVVGDDGNILKTENTGQSWTNIYSGVVEELWDIEFINRETGFVVGDFGRILKTVDGGETWRKTDSGTQENIYSIAFLNEIEGWAGTETGLRYTIDGGETWHGVPLRYQRGMIQNIKFDDYSNCYAYTLSSDINSHVDVNKFFKEYSGSYVLLQRMTDYATGIHDREDIDKLNPEQISLYPNYPNPFNATTRITYYLPKANIVSLKIYNVQGQLIRTLLNQVKTSGRHTITWNGRSDKGNMVGSGVYIYQLRYNNQIKNRKLLLLK